MRKSTFITVSIILDFIIFFCLVEWCSPKSLPSFASGYGFKVIATFVTGSLVAFLLVPMNTRLLEWRKERGRDIEEEERYESKDGVISLWPKDDNQ
jgi:hypothetical protein